ncbi:MAG: hypothetical protein M9933_19095 [Chitinophagaceae bacterium]|nr:hypothetical protein [Chitinophagaceae bacterium]
MQKKEAVRILNELISDLLTKEGYNPFQRGNEIGWINRRQTGDISFIDFGYIPAGSLNSGVFRLDPSITVSIKEIENIYKMVTTNKYLNDEIDFRTVFFKLINLEAFKDGIIKKAEHPYYRWLIDSEESIKIVEKQIRKIIEEIALPWININANVPMIDKLFNENLKSLIIYSPSNPDRAMRGIIAGKLVGRSDLEKIIKIYDKIIERCSQNIQTEYDALKRVLPSIEPRYFG